MTGELGWLVWASLVAAIVAGLLALWIWHKGRPFSGGDVFRASRWSRGNRLFPTQVLIAPSSVVHFTPQWIGRQEKTIHMAHVASVNIDTGLFFSDVVIETSGGEHPIVCHGHTRREAVRMKTLIEEHQSTYFRAPRGAASPAAPAPSSP